MLDKKGGMKSEIKITGLIKSGGHRVVIKGEERDGQGSSGGKCEVMKFVC